MERIKNHIDAEGQFIISEESLGMLLESFQAQLLFYVSGIIGKGKEEQAKDIVMHRWLDLWESRDSNNFTNIHKVKAYLYDGCYKRAIDFIRQEGAQSNYIKEVNNGGSDFEDPDTYRRELIKAQVIANLYKEISLLAPLQQKAVLLKLQGRSMYEIAGEIGISYEAARRNYQQATKNLRERFTGSLPLIMAMMAIGLIEIHSLIQYTASTNTLAC